MIPVSHSGNPMHDMAAVMARVRKMSDGQLADILSGKDVSIPQFAAMTEAMGRKQLRNAVDGAQAQQQAHQPSVKDQLLAEEASQGIAGLPAPNMEAMGQGMAAGGIVAFDGGGEVPRFDGEYGSYIDPEAARIARQTAMWERVRPDDKPYLAEDFRADVARFWDPIEGFLTMRDAKALEKAKKEQTADQPGDYPMYTPKATSFANPTPDLGAGRPEAGLPAAAAAAAKGVKNAGGAGTLKADKGDLTYEDILAKKSTDYLSPLSKYAEQQRAKLGEIKSQGLGEALMLAGKGLLSSPTWAGGVASGLGALAEKGAATRKEISGQEKELADYDLNLAKAQEAAEKGDITLALHYKQLADTNKYHMGSLGIQQQKLGLMQDQYQTLKVQQQLGKLYSDAEREVKSATANKVVKPAEYQKMVEDEYRSRARNTGLGKYIDLYSPSSSLPVVAQLPKGARTLSLNADEG